MSDEQESTVAESASIIFAPGEKVPINASGEALQIDSCLQSRVCLKIGGSENEITITLTPGEAKALREDLAEAIDASQDALARWMENGGIDRRR
jgi:hypothetical protein